MKMMALMLHDNYTSRFGLTSTAAAAEFAQLLAFNEKTIRGGKTSIRIKEHSRSIEGVLTLDTLF